MDRKEFDKLVQLVLDGEADEAGRRRLEEALASSADLRADFEFEKRLRSRLGEALQERPDELARRRVLAGFRTALAAEGVAPAAPARRSRRALATAAAVAAALLLAFWLGQRTGENDPSAEGPRRDDSLRADLDRVPAAPDIVSAINVSERHFRAEVSAERQKVGCVRRSTRNCLSCEPKSKVFDEGCGVDCQQRMREARALAASCVGDDGAKLGLPEGFELVGWRMATLRVGAETFEAPHLVFMSDTSRVSAYVLCDSRCATITQGLHRLGEGDARGDGCLWGCPQRGLVVRRCGKAWIAISSEIAMDRLQQIASEF